MSFYLAFFTLTHLTMARLTLALLIVWPFLLHEVEPGAARRIHVVPEWCGSMLRVHNMARVAMQLRHLFDPRALIGIESGQMPLTSVTLEQSPGRRP